MQRSMFLRMGMGGLLAIGIASVDFAAAQAQGTLLKDQDVSEQNVLNALRPDAAASAVGTDDAEVRRRGIRPTLHSSPAEAVLKSARRKPSVALLITFNTNSTELSVRSKEQLDVVGDALNNEQLKDFTFEVEGHADARGAHDSNLRLSQQRAEVARRYLIQSRGVAEPRLRAVGRGDNEPMNLRDAAAPENRRVAITTLPR